MRELLPQKMKGCQLSNQDRSSQSSHEKIREAMHKNLGLGQNLSPLLF